MIVHKFNKRVRYSETDKMGYLYYGNYAAYYEIGRVEFIRFLGLSYQALEDHHHIMMPVTSLEMRFVRPAYYDEMLTIQTTLKNLPEKFITFHVEIFNESGKLVNAGSVRLCFVDTVNKNTVKVPPVLLEKLTPYFEKN